MQLSVSSGKNGLIQRATFLAFGDSQDHTTAWPLADLVVSLNRWYHRASTWIWQASGTWEFDDTNSTTLPWATTALANGQSDYGLPSTAFRVMRVSVKNSAGDFQLLIPIDQTEFGLDRDEFFPTSGMPLYFDIVAGSVLLYPAPATASVTLSAGLKIEIAREVTEFSTPASYTTADSTQPGFEEPFHDILPLGAAYDYCLVNGPGDRAERYRAESESLRQDLLKHFGRRDASRKTRFKPRREKYN